jgi:hypothetical protein
MPKAKSHRKPATRKVSVSKVSTAREAIGTIEKDTDCFILTFGQFSLIDALVCILDQIGPATVDLATWTAADADLTKIGNLLEAASIDRLRLVLDRSFYNRQPGYCHRMRTIFGDDCIRFVKSHAKFMVIRNADYHIVVRTSMNLNNNPRLENIEISESEGFADFFQSVVDSIFEEVGPGEFKEDRPDLQAIPDDFPFRPIEAKQIPLAFTKEVTYSHVLRDF